MVISTLVLRVHLLLTFPDRNFYPWNNHIFINKYIIKELYENLTKFLWALMLSYVKCNVIYKHLYLLQNINPYANHDWKCDLYQSQSIFITNKTYADRQT